MPRIMIITPGSQTKKQYQGGNSSNGNANNSSQPGTTNPDTTDVNTVDRTDK